MDKEWQQRLLTAPFAVPTFADDLTNDFLTNALHHSTALPPHIRVREFKLKRSPKQGLMSEVIFLSLDFEGVQPTDDVAPLKELVAKMPIKGGPPLEQQKMGFDNERTFFTEIPDEMFSNRPKVFFAHGMCIIMQKLPGLTLDLFTPLSQLQLRYVISLLAKLHAGGWGGDKTFGQSVMHRSCLEPMLPMILEGPLGDMSLVEKIFPEVAKLTPNLVGTYGCKAKHLFKEKWFPSSLPETLILGDIKADNMFWLPPSDALPQGKITFIDFQGIGWGPAVHDVAFLLVMSLSPASYKAEWETYLGEYHAQISQHISSFSWEECRSHYINGVGAMVLTSAILAKKMHNMMQNEKEKVDTPAGQHEMRLCKMVSENIASAMAVHHYELIAEEVEKDIE